MSTPPPPAAATASAAAASSWTSEPGWLLVCTDSRRGPLTLLVLGEADIATADQLRQALLEAVAGHPDTVNDDEVIVAEVIVDVAGLDFCGLAGLDALHAGLGAAQTAGVVMTVRGMSAQLTWLHATFPRQRPPSPRPPRPSRRAAGPGIDTAGDRARRMGPRVPRPVPDGRGAR